MKLKDLGEFGFLRRIKDLFGLEIGDDCAVIDLDKKALLVSVDSLVEDVHFVLSRFSFSDLGRKAFLSSASDVVAMGVRPEFFFVSLGISPETEIKNLEELYRGFLEASSKYGAFLLGGDTVKSEKLFISLCVMGFAEEKKYVLRSTAKPGDLVFVTGSPGSSAVGLEALLNGYPSELFSRFVRKHLEPELRLEFSLFLSEKKLATSMIDISDGLAPDAERISEESDVAIVMEKKRLPALGLTERERAFLKKDELFYILFGGEDYELLFTAEPDRTSEILRASEGFGVLVTQIGYVKSGKGVYLRDGGKEKRITHLGFKHF